MFYDILLIIKSYPYRPWFESMAELDGCLECNEGYNLPKGIFQASSTNQNINETIKIFAGIGARTIPSSAVPCISSNNCKQAIMHPFSSSSDILLEAIYLLNAYLPLIKLVITVEIFHFSVIARLLDNRA